MQPHITTQKAICLASTFIFLSFLSRCRSPLLKGLDIGTPRAIRSLTPTIRL